MHQKIKGVIKSISYVLYQDEQLKMRKIRTMLLEKGFKSDISFVICLAIRFLDKEEMMTQLSRESSFGRGKWASEGQIRGAVKLTRIELDIIQDIKNSASKFNFKLGYNRIVRMAIMMVNPRKLLTQVTRNENINL